jgi:hypothetical protein
MAQRPNSSTRTLTVSFTRKDRQLLEKIRLKNRVWQTTELLRQVLREYAQIKWIIK